MKTHENELKVLQFGGGNFLRGFADWMIHRCNLMVGYNGEVCVVQSTAKEDLFAKQHGVYHVKQSGLHNDEFKHEIEQISVVTKSILIQSDFPQFFNIAKEKSIEIIISNTTEKGINFIKEEFSDKNPAQTFPGKLTQFLYERYKHKINSPLIILPCELIENNGTELKNCVLQYADHWKLEVEFTQWLNTNMAWCNTLVDRIVTGKPSEVRLNHGKHIDELYVETEWFHFWAIEGPEWAEDFLPFKKANLNVVFTQSLQPYRERKVKILNGTHTALAAAAYLAGIRTVKEAVEHPVLGKFIRRILFEEIIITITNQDKKTLEEYAEETLNSENGNDTSFYKR
ncbi:MAG: tagaturonate reductase [Cyclobacteriaceae bacterium]|nr:tagaturonate reductase [Cyclobacteriaceae bacterium]